MGSVRLFDFSAVELCQNLMQTVSYDVWLILVFNSNDGAVLWYLRWAKALVYTCRFLIALLLLVICLNGGSFV